MTNPPVLGSLGPGIICVTPMPCSRVCGTGYSQGSTALPFGRTRGHGVPGTWQSSEHTQILSPPIYSQIKAEGKTSASRLQVPDRVTQRAAGGRAGKAPQTLPRTATMPRQSSCGTTNAAAPRGWPSTRHSWGLMLGTKQ